MAASQKKTHARGAQLRLVLGLAVDETHGAVVVVDLVLAEQLLLGEPGRAEHLPDDVHLRHCDARGRLIFLILYIRVVRRFESASFVHVIIFIHLHISATVPYYLLTRRVDYEYNRLTIITVCT